jgi:serine/threonine protein kinase
VKEIQATEDAQEVAEHWEKEVKALRTMNKLNQEHIVRFITAFRRRRQHGEEEHYLMFEWADGGNLRTLWKSMPSPTLTAPLVKDVIKQVLGLAKALEAAHNLNATGASYRHGDLKPENILVFRDEGLIGTFKIGDWGEAREHGQATEMRPSKTTAKYGTRRYEAPEVQTGVQAKWLGQSTKRRSRLYDIWAMGCITLELTIWLLYGIDGLDRLDRDLGFGSFYQTNVVNGRRVAQVHSAAVRWMDQMADDPRCQVGCTAIGNLLELVRTALLVVKLPRRLGTTLSGIPERPRTDSFVESHANVARVTSQDAAIDQEAVGLTVEPAVNIPSISFTLAEPESDRIPVQPEPEARGPARCLATDFHKRTETINEEDEDESYWYAQSLDLHRLDGFSQSYSHPGSSSVPASYESGDSFRVQDHEAAMQNGVSSRCSCQAALLT